MEAQPEFNTALPGHSFEMLGTGVTPCTTTVLGGGHNRFGFDGGLPRFLPPQRRGTAPSPGSFRSTAQPPPFPSWDLQEKASRKLDHLRAFWQDFPMVRYLSKCPGLIVLGLLLLPAVGNGPPAEQHRPLPLVRVKSDLIPSTWRDLDASSLKGWDYILRICETPSFKSPLITDFCQRDGLRRIHVRRMGGDPVDLDFTLEWSYEKSGKPVAVPAWLLQMREPNNNSGFDGTTYVVQVLAPGVKRRIVRWEPTASPDDPGSEDLLDLLGRLKRDTGIYPRSGGGRVLKSN
jgi:hypothetical protein